MTGSIDPRAARHGAIRALSEGVRHAKQPAMAPHRILFVCLGNICRSPMAEGVFRRVVAEEGLTDSFVIDSAGLGDWHIGQAPDHRAQKAARIRGIDISGQSARQVVDEDFDRFDLLLVMDGSNYDELKARAPHEARGKIRPFLDFAAHAGTKDVPDPFFGGAEGFDRALDLIEAAAHGLLASLMGGEKKVRAKRGA
jgi:protein-tyrosine phosphatase